ncbi:hypothetical protein FXB41_36715 [Bradyrhizobium canariense]|nr:hypothetical protein [Bradyrhizobium canariense]
MMFKPDRALDAPLPLAGEVGTKGRVRVLSSAGVSLRRDPLPDPPPQAGEGAHRHRSCRVLTRGHNA